MVIGPINAWFLAAAPSLSVVLIPLYVIILKPLFVFIEKFGLMAHLVETSDGA